jgi:hypothetical protein
MINDQPPIPPLRQLCDERCAGGLAVTACYTTKWDVIGDDAFVLSPTAARSLRALAVCAVKFVETGLHRRHLSPHGDQFF